MATATSERFEYFASHCVMTKDCNPLGHSFLLISCIDHAKGVDAKVEILDAIGFYSTYSPITGFALYGQGRVKLEKPKYIADVKGLSHKTFKITQEEMNKLLAQVYENRQNNASPWRNNQGACDQNVCQPCKPDGPIFNAYTGRNCKNYALESLQSIGIDISDMRSILEIPKLSKDHSPLKVSKCDDHPFYWNTPLVLTPRNKHITLEENKKILFFKKFHTFHEGVKNIQALFEIRHNALLAQNRKVPEIDKALESINTIIADFEKEAIYPNRLQDELLKTMIARVTQTVQECVVSLKKEGKETNFIHLLLDSFRELMYELRHFIFDDPKARTKLSAANEIDKRLLIKIHNVNQQLSPYQTKVTNDLPTLASNFMQNVKRPIVTAFQSATSQREAANNTNFKPCPPRSTTAR